MAKKPQTTPKVLAAQEALQRAEHARLSAQRELEWAMQARFEALQALHDARVVADGRLPRAHVFVPAWQERIEVVIVRRTKGEIVTRAPGHVTEQRWRKRADGEWHQWPGRGSARRLEVVA